MNTLIKEFNARIEQSLKKAIISRLLEDINNACILALSVDKRNPDSTQFFDDFVDTIDYRIATLVHDVERFDCYDQEVSEVSYTQAE